jgi:hypothetical protein
MSSLTESGRQRPDNGRRPAGWRAAGTVPAPPKWPTTEPERTQKAPKPPKPRKKEKRRRGRGA